MYADTLKERKRQAGWTTEELAEKSGVPIGTINKILNGETKSPRYDTICALEAAFEKQEDKDKFVKEALAYGYDEEVPQYTVEDYYHFPEEVRVELINGRIYYMSAPTTKHQMAITKLVTQSSIYIDRKKGDCIPLPAPVDVQLDCDLKTMVQPDFMIICDKDKIREDRIYGAPDFVAEVLSPSSRKLDGSVKLSKYMLAGVREYWIVDIERERVISYFEEDGYIPFIYPMEEGVPVRIYGEDLKIHF